MKSRVSLSLVLLGLWLRQTTPTAGQLYSLSHSDSINTQHDTRVHDEDETRHCQTLPAKVNLLLFLRLVIKSSSNPMLL